MDAEEERESLNVKERERERERAHLDILKYLETSFQLSLVQTEIRTRLTLKNERTTNQLVIKYNNMVIADNYQGLTHVSRCWGSLTSPLL